MVGIVILNYNSWADTVACVDSSLDVRTAIPVTRLAGRLTTSYFISFIIAASFLFWDGSRITAKTGQGLTGFKHH